MYQMCKGRNTQALPFVARGQREEVTLINSQFRTKYRSLVRKARTEKIRVVRLDPGIYFVARKCNEHPHGKYIVTVKETKSGMFATCRQINGASCPSFGCCSHIAAWHERAVAEGHRELRREQSAA